jgi:hypothetical protein
VNTNHSSFLTCYQVQTVFNGLETRVTSMRDLYTVFTQMKCFDQRFHVGLVSGMNTNNDLHIGLVFEETLYGPDDDGNPLNSKVLFWDVAFHSASLPTGHYDEVMLH